jgi:transcription elongation factor Elf1
VLLECPNTVECPRCGCNDCGVIRRPSQKPGWFCQQHGRARCRACGLSFQVGIQQADSDTPPSISSPPIVDQQTPIVEHQEPPPQQQRQVAYIIYVCEDCGEKLKVTSTKGTIRHLKCRSCGATYKLGGEVRVTLTK